MKATTTNPTDEATTTVSDGGVEYRKFRLNHPKNYLGVPLAVLREEAYGEDADEIIESQIVGMSKQARNGAENLGLITDDGELTRLGDSVADKAVQIHEGSQEALDFIESLKGTRSRFIEDAPQWTEIAEKVALSYHPTQRIVSILKENGGKLTLPGLVLAAYDEDPAFAHEMFIRPSSPLAKSGDVDLEDALQDADTYRSPTTHQYKALLYHCGILTTTGADSSRLDPVEDVWELEPIGHTNWESRIAHDTFSNCSE